MDRSPPLPPPPPPPPSSSQIFHFPPVHSSGGNSFPVLAIALIGILATAFLLVSYYIFVIKCCLNWHRVDVLNSFFSRRRNPNDEIVSSATNTSSPNGNSPVQKGLDEAIIRSIPVIKFRKLVERPEFTSSSSNNTNTTMQHDTAATYECAVCLNEFEENERLRVIPNCCHAFHIDCIDVWLQSSANCPLCRSGISPSSVLCNNNHIFSHPQFRNPSSSKSSSSNSSDEDEGYVVIEIRNNNLDEPMLVHTQPQPQPHPQPQAVEEEMKECKKVKKLGHVCSMGDEMIDSMRKKDDEFQVQSIRRSISMDLSSDREFCHEIQEYCRSTTTSNNMQVSSSSSASNSNKVRRSIFSFGYGRSSRCSVQPLHLDP